MFLLASQHGDLDIYRAYCNFKDIFYPKPLHLPLELLHVIILENYRTGQKNVVWSKIFNLSRGANLIHFVGIMYITTSVLYYLSSI